MQDICQSLALGECGEEESSLPPPSPLPPQLTVAMGEGCTQQVGTDIVVCCCVILLPTSAAARKEDYYKILGVPRNADQKEIKKAYYDVHLLSFTPLPHFSPSLLSLTPLTHSSHSLLSLTPPSLLSLTPPVFLSWQRSTILIATKVTQTLQRSSPRLEKPMR